MSILNTRKNAIGVTASTLYMHRHKDKPYHIDYCFISADMADKLATVEIGEFDFWSQYSDHIPLIVTFNYT